MGEKIRKEVFDKFFTESYCPVEYETVRREFEEIASIGNDLFADGQEAMDDLNPEILDAVMDVTQSQPDGDEITERYWETGRKLLREFLLQLYDEVIAGWK